MGPALLALPFTTNVVITALIVARVVQARNAIAKLSASGVGCEAVDAIYKRVIWGVVESCAICPLFLLVALVLCSFKSNALILVTGPMVQGTSFGGIFSEGQWNKYFLFSGHDRSHSHVGSSCTRP